MSALTATAWRCHAKPAALGGKTCGHLNLAGEAIKSAHGPCCADCGCTRIAGSDRHQRAKASPSCGFWYVDYEARENDAQAFATVRITVIASCSDDAYREARLDLGERLFLGFPIAATPVGAT